MPIALSLVAISTSHMPARLACPANARPGRIPTVGTSPDRRAKITKVGAEPLPSTFMSCGRAPPPSSQQITGRRFCSAWSNMRLILAWLLALCVPA